MCVGGWWQRWGKQPGRLQKRLLARMGSSPQASLVSAWHFRVGAVAKTFRQPWHSLQGWRDENQSSNSNLGPSATGSITFRN